MKDACVIQALSQTTLQEAIALVHRVFIEEAKDPIASPGLAFTISLDPQNTTYALFWKHDKSDWFTYFVAVDGGSVIGTIGIYHQKEDPNGIVWLGWYCVEPDFRGKGIGKKLLQYIIDVAKNLGKTQLKLYTDDTLATALIIYDKFGFKTIHEEEKNGKTIIDKVLIIN